LLRISIERSVGTSGGADLSRSSSVLVLSLKTDVEQVFIDTLHDYELVDLNTLMMWKRRKVYIPLLARTLIPVTTFLSRVCRFPS
jgi:hypothetical protein